MIKLALLAMVIAHRGEHLHHPENTLAAFQGAVDAGADYFELDVRTTKDGQLVLQHDAGDIAERTQAEIQARDPRIPTFDQALAFAKNKIKVYIDSKAISAADVIAAIERHGMQDQVVIYGRAAYLKEIHALRPKLRVMPEAGNPATLRSLLATMRLTVAAFDRNDFNPETIAAAKAAKLDIFVDRLGAQDNPAAWQDAIEKGATGIQTDYPAELVRFLKGRN